MDQETREMLIAEKAHKESLALALEYSDDRLFTNANGNLPIYNEYKRRVRVITALLSEDDDVIKVVPIKGDLNAAYYAQEIRKGNYDKDE